MCASWNKCIPPPVVGRDGPRHSLNRTFPEPFSLWCSAHDVGCPWPPVSSAFSLNFGLSRTKGKDVRKCRGPLAPLEGGGIFQTPKRPTSDHHAGRVGIVLGLLLVACGVGRKEAAAVRLGRCEAKFLGVAWRSTCVGGAFAHGRSARSSSPNVCGCDGKKHRGFIREEHSENLVSLCPFFPVAEPSFVEHGRVQC